MVIAGHSRGRRAGARPPAGRPALAGLIVAALAVPAAAQDTIYVSGGGAQGYAKLNGRIVDYRGGQLRLETAGGREQTYPAERIVRIDTHHTPQQEEADALFEQGRFASARALYGQARASETRAWVRREITARIVWCYRALGQLSRASEEFLVLIRSDPATPYFACIPLAWVPSQPSMLLEQNARQWLNRDEMPAAVLLGASHLMATASRPQALARLRRLAADPSDPRIEALAAAQTWRAAVVSADEERLADWRRAIDGMPQSLRAGPYFVLGLGWAQRQNWEQAALAFMRIPVLYPEQRSLAARSLLEAGRSLEKLQRPAQAAGLYRELIDTHPESRSAADARRRLEEIVNDQ